MKAVELMTHPLVFAHLKDSIREVARLFVERKISGLPVLDDMDNPVGVITKTDLARYDRERLGMITVKKVSGRLIAQENHEVISRKLGYHLEPEEETIEAWLTPRIYTVAERDSFVDVMKLLVRLQIHRVFVKEKDSAKLLGVITSLDLLRYMSGREMRKVQARRKSQRKTRRS